MPWQVFQMSRDANDEYGDETKKAIAQELNNRQVNVKV